MRRIVCAAVAGMGLFIAASSYAASKCDLKKYGELPVTMSGTQPLIQGAINGIPARFMFDTGAWFSTLNPNSVEKFGLRVGPLPFGLSIRGTSGIDTNAHAVTAKDFALKGFIGGATLHKIDFVISGNNLLNTADGVIGQNVINHADTEYDFANGVIRLFKVEGCYDAVLAYWHGDSTFGVIKIEERTALKSQIIGSAMINGKKIRVMFDSGASHSGLTRKAAARAGIKPDDEGVIAVGHSSGEGRKAPEISLARFEILDLGGEQIKNARLLLTDGDLVGVDMLLGADFFLSHRIYVSAKQSKVYFTYNGGPVFDLRPVTARKPLLTAATEASTDESKAVPVNALKDAEAYRRRGAASIGRGDFRSAIADFDEAIKLDAQDPENFYQRGIARLQDRQAVLAMSDFDEVLKLKPDHTQALMQRATLRLAARDDAGAHADFETLDKLSPNDRTLPLQVAQIYGRSWHLAEAIQRLDGWIAANPKDDRMPLALTGRCRSRALLGKELDLAIADCNAALKTPARNSEMYESRALAWLRRGDVDKSIEDFKSAAKLQPKNPITLYGLGLAENKKGAQAEGEKNIHAALAIAPNVPNFFKRAGFVQ